MLVVAVEMVNTGMELVVKDERDGAGGHSGCGREGGGVGADRNSSGDADGTRKFKMEEEGKEAIMASVDTDRWKRRRIT